MVTRPVLYCSALHRKDLLRRASACSFRRSVRSISRRSMSESRLPVLIGMYHSWDTLVSSSLRPRSDGSLSQRSLSSIKEKAKQQRTSVRGVARRASLSRARANMPIALVRANMAATATEARAQAGSPMSTPSRTRADYFRSELTAL